MISGPPSHSRILCFTEHQLSFGEFQSNYLLNVAEIFGALPRSCGAHSPVLCTHRLLRTGIWVSSSLGLWSELGVLESLCPFRVACSQELLVKEC